MRSWLISHKKSLTGLLLLLVLLIGGWQFVSAKLAQTLQATLLERAGNAVNGRITVGKIDLSLSGRIRIRDIALYDREGALLLQSPSVKIRYRWSDLTSGSLGLPQVEQVLLEQSEIFVKQNGAAFNWNGFLKEDEESHSTVNAFHGKVVLENSVIFLDTALGERTLTGINGSFDWRQAPVIALQAGGMLGKDAFTVQGSWAGEIVLQAETLDLAGFSDLLALGDTTLEAGTVRDLAVYVTQDEKGTLSYHAKGVMDGVKAAGAFALQEGKSDFQLDADGVTFTGLSGLVSGQQVNGQGTVFWGSGQPQLDFTLNLPNVDAAAFVSGLSVGQPLVIDARVSGSGTAPVITGAFKTHEVGLGEVAASDVAGSFRFADGQLALDQVRGNAYQGVLNAAGQVAPDTQQYQFAVSGQGMNSSRLTDKDVSGPLDFTGTVSGQGESAVTRGNFIIRDGKAYGLSFQSLTGSFVKQGDKTEISDIAVHTALGTLYPEQLSQEALDMLKEKAVPVSKTELRQAVTDQLRKKLFR
ncbi:hypothetical protein HSX37_17895|uniref:AsmA-like C-terminal region n=1 Tax=Dendrosporobacter quercicolus TaxID=146817 RepID=A0A1G9XBB9_9FIRM|nr:hypothetical protein [Dendrosporobacter quercicolus]NSL49892.1 hypothetical protein [Dendrosporobacter quercicolus DSM 1736]SDM94028.1 hypothetical protein SAMN04488502_10944 [Dendrosporobacter quercicolus]